MVLTDTYHPAFENYPQCPYDNIFAEEPMLSPSEWQDVLTTLTEVLSPSCCTDTNTILDDELDLTIEQELFNDQLLASTTLGPSTTFSYTMEWIHKKGKKKPQQFWVYCEDKQQSYARISLTSENMQWASTSRMFIIQELQKLCFVQSFAPKANFQRTLCLEYSPDMNSFIGNECMIATETLIPIDKSQLELNFFLEGDTDAPVHPLQGNSADVQMTCQVGNIECTASGGIREPFQFFAMFSFRNRVEGWFKLKIVLSYGGIELFTSYSDLFMFNNPRLKKRKELAMHPPKTVKFIQAFASSPKPDQEEWLNLANSLGYNIDRQLLNLGLTVFGRCLNKRQLPCEFEVPEVPAKKAATMTTITCVIEDSSYDTANQQEDISLKSYSYAWLSEDGSNLETGFFATHLLSGRNNYADFVREVNVKYPTRTLKRIFLRQGTQIIEIQNATDFQCLTGPIAVPQLLLSQSEKDSILLAVGTSALSHAGYTFTIRAPSFSIVEVYTTSVSLVELRKAISIELKLTPPQESSLTLKKSATKALLYKDENLIHLSATDIIDVSW